MLISFILVEPAVPENIGAAARALNTMGFNDLRLVNPANHLADKAKWLAHGSISVLEKAKLFTSFEAAVADLDFIIGTTAKKRSARYDYYRPEVAKEILFSKSGVVSKAGIVFGREESGLKNHELAQCDIASSIPLKNQYPSINLAQSVMLYAYVFSELPKEAEKHKTINLHPTPLYRELKENAKSILAKINIEKDSVMYGRMMERLATANEDDVRLFLSFAKNFNRIFE